VRNERDKLGFESSVCGGGWVRHMGSFLRIGSQRNGDA
jgi:hypothetical protein